ncbi:hypothetical protein FUT88_18605 [Ralstonia sp. TCR112]|nr:hypothetical protein FUT88_18605 [Ralstonia sp. TCR112]
MPCPAPYTTPGWPRTGTAGREAGCNWWRASVLLGRPIQCGQAAAGGGRNRDEKQVSINGGGRPRL